MTKRTGILECCKERDIFFEIEYGFIALLSRCFIGIYIVGFLVQTRF